ncbi:hypothetical protein TDB9533_00091 [Thalassocella blandensis]|nr:hypothetical protein TDB9533_00091 [Thalassocella blandensis]
MKKEGLVLTCIAVICLCANYFMGKDLNWDAVNYHLYSPFQLFSNRVGSDFFAASVQGYLNPLVFTPFYLMVKAQWHSFIISSFFALVHSLNFYVIYKITEKLICKTKQSQWVVILSVGLSALNGVIWVVFGSSFSDLIISLPVLCAVWALLSGNDRAFCTAGLLMGVAAGLKITSVIFAIPGIIFCLNSSRRLKASISYIAFGVVGLLLSSGYWMYLMWSHFGNPFFPFFNNLFHSSFFSQDSIVDARFTDYSLGQLVVTPLKMMLPATWIYIERQAPDVRILLVMLLSLAAFFKSLIAKWKDGAEIARLNWESVFLLYFGLAFCFWCMVSGNGRYALPLLLLCGPALIVLALKLFRKHFALWFVSILMGAQSFLLISSPPERYAERLWTRTWFEFEPPEKMKNEAALYLNPLTQTASFVAPFINRNSSLVNISGQWNIPVQSEAGEKVKSLIGKFKGRVKALFPQQHFEAVEQDDQRIVQAALGYDDVFKMYALQIVPSTCESFSSAEDGQAPEWSFVVCDLESYGSNEDLLKEQAYVERLYNYMERHCGLLRFKGSAPIKVYGNWTKTYLLKSIRVTLRDGVMVASYERSLSEVLLGTEKQINQWVESDKDYNCDLSELKRMEI